MPQTNLVMALTQTWKNHLKNSNKKSEYCHAKFKQGRQVLSFSETEFSTFTQLNQQHVKICDKYCKNVK